VEIRISVIDKSIVSEESLLNALEYGAPLEDTPDFISVWSGGTHVEESIHYSLTHPGLDVLGGLVAALVAWVPGNVYSVTVSDHSVPFRMQMGDKLSEGFTNCWVGYTKAWNGTAYTYSFEILCFYY
jgi:hypothetical protein